VSEPWALVTGASYGVGRAVAVRLARAGYNVIATARTKSAIDITAERVKSIGRQAVAVDADLTVNDDLSRITDTVEKHAEGSLALFVHCAFGHIGEEEGRSLESVTIPEIKDFVAVSVTGTYLVTRALLPSVRAASGRMIFIVADWGLPTHNILTSTFGETDAPLGSEVFNSAKYAVNGFINSLERLSHVRCSGIYPGIIASAYQREYPPEALAEGYLDIDSDPAEIREAGYDVPNDSIPLSDVAESVYFAATTIATVRTIHLKPVDFGYTGL